MSGKTIIILGTGPSMVFCDFKADEIYGVNGTYTMPNVMPAEHKDKFWMSKLFMGDTLFSFETGSLNFDIEGMNKFAAENKCEMYSINKLELGKHVLNAKKYPYKRITTYFGCELFTDTVCYMIAFALYKHSYLAANPAGVVRPELSEPLALKLFGIDMTTTSEYKQSKGGVEHWIGVGRGMGCEITVAPRSAIMSNPYSVPYGCWYRLKWKKKDYDPLGLMSGNVVETTKQADGIERKMREKEDAEGTGTTDQEWCEGNQQRNPVRNIRGG